MLPIGTPFSNIGKTITQQGSGLYLKLEAHFLAYGILSHQILPQTSFLLVLKVGVDTQNLEQIF